MATASGATKRLRKACANKTGSLASVEAQGLSTCAEMTGHPSIGRYMDEGWRVLTF